MALALEPIGQGIAELVFRGPPGGGEDRTAIAFLLDHRSTAMILLYDPTLAMTTITMSVLMAVWLPLTRRKRR